MRDIDRDVEALLERMAAEAGEAGPLPALMARRAATRRAGAIAGAALLVGVLSAGVFLATAGDDGKHHRGSPVTVGPEDRPAEPRLHRPPLPFKGELVAQGETTGVRWWLTAHTDDNADLCTEFFTEDENGGASGGAGCGPFGPKGHPVGLGLHSGDGFPSATGHVPLEVERLELVMRDGTIFPVIQFHDAPKGFEFPAKFYVVIPFPRGVEEVVAYDGAGEVVGRQEVFSPSDEPKSARVVRQFSIDEGEHEGLPYVLKGYVVEQELPDGGSWTYPCHEFFLGEGERYGGGGGCDIPLARGREINFSQTSFKSHPNIVAVHGGVQPGVDRVTIELDSGERFEADVFDVPQTDFGFYLVFPEAPRGEALSGEVVAYRGSQEVERLELCDPDLANLGSSCGP